MIENISVETTEEKNIPIVKVKGEIDIYTCGKLRSALSAIIDTGSKNFVLDLDDIIYIDSTGLGTIAHTARTIEKESGVIHIICKKPQIKKIFEVSGLERKNITLYENSTEVELINEIWYK